VVHDRVPDGYEFRFDRDDMGRVDTTFASLRTSDHFRRLNVTAASDLLAAGFDVNARWPQRRTDYYSPGFTWQTNTALSAVPPTYENTGYEVTSPITMTAGERRTLCLYCAPFGPELGRPQPDPQTGEPLPWAYRRGDRLTVTVPMFGSRDPDTYTVLDPTNTGTTVLSRDGKEIGRNDVPGRGDFDVPRGTGRYTLVSDAAKTGPEWPLSVRTRAEWTFVSTPSSGRKVLPLLDVRYDLPLDDSNGAPASGMSGFVSAVHQDGAARVPVRGLSVDVSFDDGVSWRPASVAPAGSRWKVALPAGTGYASLRTTAVDAAGNSVTETITRAYRVR
jgi:hypothetical protein